MRAPSYLQARAWASGHGLPRYVFVRFTGEPKQPAYYVDLASGASIDRISRSARRARRDAGPDASVTVVEMLPALGTRPGSPTRATSVSAPGYAWWRSTSEPLT